MKIAMRALAFTVILATSSFGLQSNARFAGGGGPIPMPTGPGQASFAGGGGPIPMPTGPGQASFAGGGGPIPMPTGPGLSAH
jgi:hypothetical protein